MKFAHIADCHIGGWRDPKLSSLPEKAFRIAIDKCIEEKVDFILIAGDLFNTSIPGIDKIKTATQALKKLNDNDIPTYIIAGSHDFSPSGKTMLDVLEEAGLCINVVKGEVIDKSLKLNFTIDKKTGVKITGMLGLRNMLEKKYYERLIKDHLESEEGFKIFMFHTALTELKPKYMERMDSSPISLLPKNFDYYAGGHVHIIEHQSLPGYKNVIYPGPLFPNSFSELQQLSNGGFYIYNNGVITRHEIKLNPVVNITIDCNRKSSEEIEKDIKKELGKYSLSNAIVLIKLFGTIESGRISSINFTEISNFIYENGAYFMMKNISGLKTKEFEEIKVDMGSVEDIEDKIITEHLGQMRLNENEMPKEEERILTKQLMALLNKEKDEAEKVSDFEDRLREEIFEVLKLNF